MLVNLRHRSREEVCVLDSTEETGRRRTSGGECRTSCEDSSGREDEFGMHGEDTDKVKTAEERG
jgi:hypothetical protein